MERIQLDPSQLVDTVQQLLHEGNVRRIVIKQGDHTVVEFPLTVGVVGANAAPTLAAVGAIAALLTDCTIEIERDEPAPASPALTDEAGKPLTG